MTLMSPRVSEALRKQMAMLNHKYVADLTLKAVLDFVDCNDPSMVNMVLSSVAKVYENMSKNEFEVQYLLDQHTKSPS